MGEFRTLDLDDARYWAENAEEGSVVKEFARQVVAYAWFLAQARWWAESTRGLLDAALDEFAPFPNVVKKPFPWEPDWQLSDSDIAKAQELWARNVEDAHG